MNRFPRKFAAALLSAVFLAGSTPLFAQVYQYEAVVKDVSGKDIKAFLWVPPQADRIRGVLVGGMTVMEPAFAGDPQIRAACADEKLAIVYFNPPLDALFNYRERNAGDVLLKALADLGKLSGYHEIAVAPLMPYGHSVSSIFASRVAQWKPERCFGALPFKGALEMPPDDHPDCLLGVPILATKGQFEEFGPGPSGVLRDSEDRESPWKSVRDILIQLRERNDRHLVSLLVEAGSTHFAWSSRVAAYTALFIRKAAQRRIPDWPVDSQTPPKLNEIDPASGALTSADVTTPNHSPAAPYKEFKGDPKKAFWHLDLELAKAWDAFNAGTFDKKAQFVTFSDAKTGAPLSVGSDMRLTLSPNWVGPDTLKFSGAFVNKAPAKYPHAGEPAGHANSPTLFRAYVGAVEQTGPDTFRVSPNGRQPVRAEILTYNDGDAVYGHAEQPGRCKIPDRLTEGKTQTIAFELVGALKSNNPTVKLTAKSDSGLPVRYYVESGPAVIEGDSLKVTDLPKRASLPIKVTVVAYQYGSAIDLKVQSAAPVTRTVSLEK